MHPAKTIAVAALFLVACGGGGGSSQPTTTPSTNGGATSGPVAIAPLKLVLDKDGKVGLEVRADGSIVTGDGELVASFDGRKLVGTHGGKGVVIGDDGTIHPLDPAAPEDDVKLHFDDNGDLVTSKGDKIAVDASGVPSISDGGKPAEAIPAHIVGMTPQTHRLAVLLTFVAMMAHERSQESATTSASASAVPPPATPHPPPTPAP